MLGILRGVGGDLVGTEILKELSSRLSAILGSRPWQKSAGPELFSLFLFASSALCWVGDVARIRWARAVQFVSVCSVIYNQNGGVVLHPLLGQTMSVR